MQKSQGIYYPLGIEKINSVAFLEVKLLTEKLREGWKIEHLTKIEGLLIKTREYMHNMLVIQSETLLPIPCRKVPCLSTKKWGIHCPGSSS